MEVKVAKLSSSFSTWLRENTAGFLNPFLDTCLPSINLAFWAVTPELVFNTSLQKPVNIWGLPRERVQWGSTHSGDGRFQSQSARGRLPGLPRWSLLLRMQIGWENNREPQTEIYFPLLYKCPQAGSAGLVHRLRSPEFTGTQLLPAFCSTIPTVQPWSKMSFTHNRRKEEERRKEGAVRTSQLSLVVPWNYPKHYFFLSLITLNCKGGYAVWATCPDGTVLTPRKRWKQILVHSRPLHTPCDLSHFMLLTSHLGNGNNDSVSHHKVTGNMKW